MFLGRILTFQIGRDRLRDNARRFPLSLPGEASQPRGVDQRAGFLDEHAIVSQMITKPDVKTKPEVIQKLFLYTYTQHANMYNILKFQVRTFISLGCAHLSIKET